MVIRVQVMALALETQKRQILYYKLKNKQTKKVKHRLLKKRRLSLYYVNYSITLNVLLWLKSRLALRRRTPQGKWLLPHAPTLTHSNF